jgi:MFS family permease
LSRGGTVLMAALVVDSIGNGLFIPLSLIFFVQLTDVPLGPLGVLISAATVLALPVPVWAGSLADRFGALPVVVGAQVLQGVGFLGYNSAGGPAGIFTVSALVAIGVRFFWSSVFTAVADFADGSARTLSKETWFAWTGMARTAGLGAGGLLAGAVLADGRDVAYRATAWVTAACFLTAAVLIAAFVRAPRHPATTGSAATGSSATDTPAATGSRMGTGYRTMLRDRPFLLFTGINSVFATTSTMLVLGLPVVVVAGLHGPRVLVPAILVGNTVLLAVIAAPVVRRLTRYRRSRLIIAAAALWAAWCGLYAVLVPDRPVWVIPLLVLGAALFTAAELIHAPVSMALATALAPTAVRGRYLAVFQYSFALAGIVGPAFFTTLFELHRSLPWIALGAVNVAAALAMRLLERQIPDSAQRDPAREATAHRARDPARDPAGETTGKRRLPWVP